MALPPTYPWGCPTLRCRTLAFHPRKSLPQPTCPSIRDLTACMILPLSSVFCDPALPVTFLSQVLQLKGQSAFPINPPVNCNKTRASPGYTALHTHVNHAGQRNANICSVLLHVHQSHPVPATTILRRLQPLFVLLPPAAVVWMPSSQLPVML